MRSVGFMISTCGYAISRRFRQILAPLQEAFRDASLGDDELSALFTDSAAGIYVANAVDEG